MRVGEVREVRGIRGELAGLGEVDEGTNASGEEFVEFLGGRLEWGPRVFAGEETGGCPVGVGDGTRAACVDGWQRRAALGLAGDWRLADVDGRDVEGVGHLWVGW